MFLLLTQSQRERLVAGHDVVAVDPHQDEGQLLAQLDGVVAVLQDLDLALGVDLAVLVLPGCGRFSSVRMVRLMFGKYCRHLITLQQPFRHWKHRSGTVV